MNNSVLSMVLSAAESGLHQSYLSFALTKEEGEREGDSLGVIP